MSVANSRTVVYSLLYWRGMRTVEVVLGHNDLGLELLQAVSGLPLLRRLSGDFTKLCAAR